MLRVLFICTCPLLAQADIVPGSETVIAKYRIMAAVDKQY